MIVPVSWSRVKERQGVRLRGGRLSTHLLTRPAPEEACGGRKLGQQAAVHPPPGAGSCDLIKTRVFSKGESFDLRLSESFCIREMLIMSRIAAPGGERKGAFLFCFEFTHN